MNPLRSRCLAFTMCLGLWAASLDCFGGLLLPVAPGLPHYQRSSVVSVPGGRVNAASGNLSVSRRDLSLDTLMGPWQVRATYDSAAGRWRWNHQIRYADGIFIDESGTRHQLGSLSPGSPVLGSVWSKVDAHRVRTRSGVVYEFDVGGRLAVIHRGGGDLARLEFRSTPTGTEVFQCSAAAVCHLLYSVVDNLEGDPLSIVGAPMGRAVTYDYDEQGRLVVARSALDVAHFGSGTRYEYDGTLLTALTTPEDERIEYGYQAARRIGWVREVGEGDPIHRFDFGWIDTEGLHPVVHTNPLGGRTRYRFDALGRLRDVLRSDSGETHTFEWSGLRAVRETRSNGAVTHLTYEEDNLVQIDDATGNRIRFEYEVEALGSGEPAIPAIASVVDDLGTVLEQSFDEWGRVLEIVDGSGERTVFERHPTSLVSTLTSPNGAMVTFPVYGIHGHWLELEGSSNDRRRIDAVGNVLVPSVRVQEGGVVERSYDAGRYVRGLEVARMQDGSMTHTDEISIQRRSDGQLLRIDRPGGAVHEYVYDTLGRLAERRELVSGTFRSTVFEYDRFGNRISTTRPNGMREEVDYDVYGRVLRRSVSRDGDLEGVLVYVYVDGQLARTEDSMSGITETYSRDPAGRLVRIDYSSGESLSRAYDVRSRLLAETFVESDGEVIADLGYGYDGADREIAVFDRISGEIFVERSIEDSRIVEERFGNGLTSTHVFDAETRDYLRSETSNEGGDLVAIRARSSTHEEGPARRQVRVTTETPLASTTEEYWLSPAGNLSTVSGRTGSRLMAWGDGSGSLRPYAWSETSNRIAGVAGEEFVYDEEGVRLLEAHSVGEGTNVSFEYDEAGYASARNGVPIAWTAHGRLASIGDWVLSWDMQGRLRGVGDGGNWRDFSSFGGRVERGALHSGGEVLDLGVVVLGLGDGSRSYRHEGLRGSVSFTSDATGQITSHHHYGPFGRIASHGPGLVDRAFESQREVGGLVIMGARIYDPAVGRFFSPDPQLNFVNQYAYTLGNPVDYHDTNGRVAITRGVFKAALGTLALAAAALANHPLAPPNVRLFAAVVALTATAGVLLMDWVESFENQPHETRITPGASTRGFDGSRIGFGGILIPMPTHSLGNLGVDFLFSWL
ncbi:hypothetical protein MK489_18865 [Myxococcota bacterium]|nr:hypothetical protein [Myxococcota bacterium]